MKKTTIDPSLLPPPDIVSLPTPREKMMMATYVISRILETDAAPQRKQAYLDDMADSLPADYFRDLLERYSNEDMRLTWLKAHLAAQNPDWQTWRHYGYTLDPLVLSGLKEMRPKTINDESYAYGDLPWHARIFRHLGEKKAEQWWTEHGDARFYDWRPVVQFLEEAHEFRVGWLRSKMVLLLPCTDLRKEKGGFIKFAEWIKYADAKVWNKKEARAAFKAVYHEASPAEWRRLLSELAVPPEEGIQCADCPKRHTFLKLELKKRLS